MLTYVYLLFLSFNLKFLGLGRSRSQEFGLLRGKA
jgi:hypothetical protein